MSLVPAFDDIPDSFRYDPRGAARGWFESFRALTVGYTLSILMMLLLDTRMEILKPILITYGVFITLGVALFLLNRWSKKQFSRMFLGWLEKEKGLKGPADFSLEGAYRTELVDMATGEKSIYEFEFSPVSLQKSFLGLSYSADYRKVTVEKAELAPRFKV